jgi:nucleotide-binding universal stress UspA family protein
MTEILLAYDGSEPAEHAREVVFDRFDPDVVTVLFVFDPGEAGYEAPDPFGTDTELTELATERAEEVFTSFEVPGESDTTVRTVHEVGHPARTVVNHAARDDVDHVVVGSHGREGVSRLLLGSVAEKIVRRSPVPVTVVR